MKPSIHPDYRGIRVTCACGNAFDTRSTLGRDLYVEVCAADHPFYSGQQRIVDAAGRIDRFRRQYVSRARG